MRSLRIFWFILGLLALVGGVVTLQTMLPLGRGFEAFFGGGLALLVAGTLLLWKKRLIIRLLSLSSLAPAHFASPRQVSILLPVLNESPNLRACLAAITIPAEIPTEIVVIDGGSSDDTPVIAAQDPRVRLVHSPRGRGTQIAKGYEVAQGDLLLILHADSRLQPNTINDIWNHCLLNPHVAGGACTARYEHSDPRFRLSEFLNDLRVRWFGITFGDQVQFFRRAAVPPAQFPDFKLMEDIELSLRIQHAGTMALVRTKVIASHRRWVKVGFTRNTVEVIGLSVAYLVLRGFGLVKDKGERFYQYYYFPNNGKN